MSSNEVPPGSHTPEPWAWEAQDASMMSLGTSDGRGGVDLAREVLTVIRCKSCQKDPRNRRCMMPTDADAHLIRSAPTMLAALLKVREAMTSMLGYEHYLTNFASVEAAIASAHGAKP